MLFGNKLPASEKRITLSQVSWEQLEALLQDLGNQRSTRITYYQGKLEIFDPCPNHDRITRLMDSLLQVLADEAGDNLCNLGSQLLKQAEMAIAIQPDSCYSLDQRGQAQRAGDRAELNLPKVPPPDLVIDIQLNQASPKRLGLFAGLGIPEVWQYVTSIDAAQVLKGQLTLLGLEGHRYEPIAHSRLYDFCQPNSSATLFSKVTAWVLSRHWLSCAIGHGRRAIARPRAPEITHAQSRTPNRNRALHSCALHNFAPASSYLIPSKKVQMRFLKS
ncbi:MAG: Uma2 family endonuclease [Synechococcales cyanobacterium CRU_2_2]|nr:Uma2 family endonuclease [Synechococcales cyanobacterium CRU_2_2]